MLIVDEHRVFAESLATALSAEPDVEAVAAGSVPAATQMLDRSRAMGSPFQVVLLDTGLTSAAPAAAGEEGAAAGTAPPPGGAGGQAPEMTAVIDALHERFPALRPVMLATEDDAPVAARALAAGACGWIAKDSSLAQLLLVVRGVLRDETHLPPALLTGVLRELTRDRHHRSERQRLVESLTPRELEVLRCMLAGLGRKAVAERLYLSPHTVRTHMQNVLGKLGVHSTLAAVALARRAGIPPAD
ncbi:DNA-binding response regulator, NarL/FixJ family, contains REC and HTH domains [Streptomyces aidingensis]|uniref:DNA-binding response regulator, NarL/FixJ family, contains REC and HTH domains n=1 Tax=Streptomyces aidingensis TaxID=910347 RepID=A0A1I1GZW4_9ACTN|nr:DNA-binding response regulator, NarL/FixJ family, contains REC and HTH domains [Streptomyces aidingensis]